MKAIIIAAGMGNRLNPLNTKPKCLLEVEGKTILQYQLDAYSTNGVTDISAVTGYEKEQITHPNIKYYVNDNYENNNILNSLFYAEEEMNDEFIASYSDIIFGENVVKKLLESTADISVVVDTDWEGYYEGRTDHPISEAENVIFDENKNVKEIGKIVDNDKEINGEFIGMIKCTKKGAEIFREWYQKAKAEFEGEPFIRAKIFDKAYLTDFLQYLVNNNITVGCAIIEGGWVEIDTIQDIERAPKFLKFMRA